MEKSRDRRELRPILMQTENRKRQRPVVLRPGNGSLFRQTAHRCVVRLNHLLPAGVNGDRRDHGWRAPRFQQRLRHEQFAHRRRMNGRESNHEPVRGPWLRLLQHVEHRRHEVHAHQMMLGGELADKICITLETPL